MLARVAPRAGAWIETGLQRNRQGGTAEAAVKLVRLDKVQALLVTTMKFGYINKQRIGSFCGEEWGREVSAATLAPGAGY